MDIGGLAEIIEAITASPVINLVALVALVVMVGRGKSDSKTGDALDTLLRIHGESSVKTADAIVELKTWALSQAGAIQSLSDTLAPVPSLLNQLKVSNESQTAILTTFTAGVVEQHEKQQADIAAISAEVDRVKVDVKQAGKSIVDTHTSMAEVLSRMAGIEQALKEARETEEYLRAIAEKYDVEGLQKRLETVVLLVEQAVKQHQEIRQDIADMLMQQTADIQQALENNNEPAEKETDDA